MSDTLSFILDGRWVDARRGQTIIEAADDAGVYIPRLCHKPGLEPWGGCRLCTVYVNGRPLSACTQPVADGVLVESDTDELNGDRRRIIEMLFVEGNHFCMVCEKSGACELQALAYRFGITAPRFPYAFPERDVDATHPDLLIDHNRCILCARCVRTSRDVDGKCVFGFVGRGSDKRLAVNAPSHLVQTDAASSDRAFDACPVGALLRKRQAYQVPIGQRPYDHEPIGSDIEG